MAAVEALPGIQDDSHDRVPALDGEDLQSDCSARKGSAHRALLSEEPGQETSVSKKALRSTKYRDFTRKERFKNYYCKNKRVYPLQ